jgi:hypothetical protein
VDIVTIPIVDEKGRTLRTDCRVEFEGEICPYVSVESGIGKRLVGYEIIKRDLNDCLQILEAIENKITDEPMLLNALWESFTTKYGRCFADANKGRGVKLEDKDIFDTDTPNFKEHHEYLINERNNFSAHAGNSDSDIFEVRLALKPPAKGKDRYGFYISRDIAISPSPEALLEHKQLVEHVISFVDGKLDGIYERIKKDYEEIDIDKLYEDSKTIIA